MFPFVCRYCVCYKHKSMECMLQSTVVSLRDNHHQPCDCACASCLAGCCGNLKDNISSFMKHLFCQPTFSLSGPVHFYDWSCLTFECELCWMTKDYLVFNCPISQWNSDTGIYSTSPWRYSTFFYSDSFRCLSYQNLLHGKSIHMSIIWSPIAQLLLVLVP